MDNRLVFKDFFSFGVAAALLWHLFWFFLIVPEIKIPSYAKPKSDSIFLGAILQESDLLPVFARPRNKSFQAWSQKDYSRDIYFRKKSMMMCKPAVFSGHRQPRGKDNIGQKQFSEKTEMICFGLSDIGRYLSNIDFSDMKNMFLREDLSGIMDFKVLLTERGTVESIKKCIGSGDPALDFYIMRKLKMAIFKQPFIRSGWMDVRFKIK